MKNFTVVTPTRLVKDQVKEFVEAQGGYWNIEPTLDQGVIESNLGAVYISVETDIQPYDYDSSEIEKLAVIIGSKPRSLLSIHIGHGEGSNELAEDVAESMMRLWGGFLDRDNSIDSDDRLA